MNVTSDLQQAIDDAQATIRFRFPTWLRPFVARDVIAITLGRRVYLAAELTGEALERLLRHELEHVRQINRFGLLRFYTRYVFEYVRHRRSGMTAHDAYRNISFERDAFRAESATVRDV